MPKEELITRKNAIETKFNELKAQQEAFRSQQNEVEQELLRLQGQYALLEELIRSLDSEATDTEDSSTPDPSMED